MKHCFLGVNRRSGLLICGLFFAGFSLFGQKTAQLKITDLQKVTKRTSLSYFSENELQSKVGELQSAAYKKGYITFSIDSIVSIDSTQSEVYGSIGQAFKTIDLYFTESSKQSLGRIGIIIRRNRSAEIGSSPQAVGTYLSDLLKKFESNGYPFASVRFDSLTIKNEHLAVTALIESGPLVTWKGVEIISSKSKFSERFISNYFHIEKGGVFNQQELDQLPLRMKQLSYVKEMKPSELLFTTEGAILYLYLESKPVSSFSGTVGLQQDPIKLKTQLTGDIRLKLLNNFKRGELMELSWRSIQPGSPQLKTSVSIPYLFQTPFGIDGQFQLFKRDSTFLELKSGLGVNYFLSSGNQLKAFYQRYSSDILSSTNTNTNLGNTVSNQYGLSIQHLQLDYIPNPHKGSNWSVTGAVGTRNLTKDTVTSHSLIYSTTVKGDFYIPLGKRFVFKTGGSVESFYTQSIQQNELIRFGGNGNQRGFLEDELLASTRATATAEVRFILDQNSALFAFFDQTWYERNTTAYLNDHPYGFGTGLSFGTNLGIFSISVALGQQFDNPILLRDSKVHVGYIAYF